ncbi:MAG: hypothetical protein AAF004_06520 [Pseudomonadota bacterium]
MQAIAGLIESGRIVDLMLAVIALEVVVLCAYRVNSGRGLSIPSILLNVGAGGSLMVALKLVLTDASWQWIAVALVASLICHAADLGMRWKNSL